MTSTSMSLSIQGECSAHTNLHMLVRRLHHQQIIEKIDRPMLGLLTCLGQMLQLNFPPFAMVCLLQFIFECECQGPPCSVKPAEPCQQVASSYLSVQLANSTIKFAYVMFCLSMNNYAMKNLPRLYGLHKQVVNFSYHLIFQYTRDQKYVDTCM